MKPRVAILFAFVVLLAAILACSRSTTPISSGGNSGETPAAPEAPAPTGTPEFSGPCANVLYPFLPGRQWVYQKMLVTEDTAATPDPLTSRFGISVTEVNGSQAILNAVDMGTGATSRTTADCQDGAITNFPMMVLGSVFGNYLSGDIQVNYVSGLFAPGITELDASGWNMQWQGEYVASGEVALSVDGEQSSATLKDSPVHMTWQNAGQETVTVPAGTFENAYKVSRTTVVNASVDFEGMSGRGTLTVKTDHWFVPYTGLVKSKILSAELSVFGISFPITVDGSSVELVEVRP
jgi:hypothetical protein